VRAGYHHAPWLGCREFVLKSYRKRPYELKQVFALMLFGDVLIGDVTMHEGKKYPHANKNLIYIQMCTIL
jgi:hypothetical protein